jgi:hypothetical protein
MVYGNDFPILLQVVVAIPVLVLCIYITCLAWHRFRTCFLLLVLVGAFFLYRHLMIKVRLENCTASCANHSSFWAPSLYNYADEPLPLTSEFATFLETVHRDEQPRPYNLGFLTGRRCPGYRRTGTKTGVVFVGGGLLPNSLPKVDTLIAFCEWECHPPPYDHQHCLIWEWRTVNGEYSGSFYRQCVGDTMQMIELLEVALQQGKNGTVPYTQEAQNVLRYELEKRRELLPRDGRND